MPSDHSKLSPDIILVVDDTPAYLRMTNQLLAEQGYVVRPALTGKRALEYCQIELPDLILLDIRLPDIDGFEVCRQLKADTRTADIPIIFFSVAQGERDKARAFAEGGVDFVSKPFLAEELLARIKTHLELRKLQRNLEDQVDERTRELHEITKRYQVFVADNPAAIWHYEIQPPMPIDLPAEEQIDWILNRSVLVEANEANASYLRIETVDDLIGTSLRTYPKIAMSCKT